MRLFAQVGALFAILLFGMSAGAELLPDKIAVPKPKLRGVQRRRHLEVENNLKQLEDSVERLEAEIEVLKAQERLLVQGTGQPFLNETYLKGAFAVIFPVNSTFTLPLNGYGIGIAAGVGHYFGRHHVWELGAGVDIGFFADLRYRYELHLESPSITFGPMIGYRRRISASPLPNNFVPDAKSIKENFLLAGAIVALNFGRTIAEAELSAATNTQTIVFFNTSFHLFL